MSGLIFSYDTNILSSKPVMTIWKVITKGMLSDLPPNSPSCQYKKCVMIAEEKFCLVASEAPQGVVCIVLK